MGGGRRVGESTSQGAARARIELDVSALQGAATAARQHGTAVRREMQDMARDAASAQESIRSLSAEVHQMQMTTVGANGLQVIDFAALDQARSTMKEVAGDVRSMANDAKAANLSISQMMGGLRMAAGVLGLSFGAAGVRQVIGFAAEAEGMAMAYARQRVAAENLAGSQSKLNALLETYREVTRGTVSEADALADVTKLLALGFADSSADLERFLRGVRGASAAMGKDQDFIITNLQLEMLNQTGRRLDQIGLDMETVRERAVELRQANSGLTKEQAYQVAVLDELLRRYGALSESPLMNPTAQESVSKSWRDLSLAVGQLFGPSVNFAGSLLARELDRIARRTEEWLEALRAAATLLGLIPKEMKELPAELGSRTGIGAHIRETPAEMQRQYNEEQLEVMDEWARDVQRVEESAARARVSATEQYEAQRNQVIANYYRQSQREAEDFARNRARSDAQYAENVAKVHTSAAEREERMARDLADRLADIRGDSARRMGDWQEDYERRVTEIREDGLARIAELEEDYQRDRERAGRAHRDNLLRAAGNLDAAAVAAEQRRYAQAQAEAEQAHQDRVESEQSSIDERIAQEQESHRIRMEREQRNLAERIAQEQAAHQKRLDDARAADERRLAEMQAAFDAQRRKEDEDRAIRLARQAEDHQRQLAEMASAQDARMAQIERQLAQEKALLDVSFQDRLADVGVFVAGWRQTQQEWEKTVLESFENWWKAMNAVITGEPKPDGYAEGGPVRQTGPALIHAGEYVLNPRTTAALHSMLGGFDQRSLLGAVGGGGRGVSVGEVSIMVNGGSGSPDDIAQTVRRVVIDVFSEIGAGA